MHFWSQVGDKAAAGRHSVGGNGRSWDDRHRRSWRRKPEGNGRCSVPLQQLTSVPGSWRPGELFPLLYVPELLLGLVRLHSGFNLLSNRTLEFVQMFDVCVKSAGGARVGLSDWFSAYPGLAAGSSHSLQQCGSGDAPAFPQNQFNGCTCGSQPGGGAVDQRQTGGKSENSDWRTAETEAVALDCKAFVVLR